LEDKFGNQINCSKRYRNVIFIIFIDKYILLEKCYYESVMPLGNRFAASASHESNRRERVLLLVAGSGCKTVS